MLQICYNQPGELAAFIQFLEAKRLFTNSLKTKKEKEAELQFKVTIRTNVNKF